jgi:hypothetical protein
MQLWDSMCWPHVNPVLSGAVGKDCQRRLLNRPRFVRAVAPRIIIIIIITLNFNMACEGTAQNFTLRKWGTKQDVAKKNAYVNL